MALAGSRRPKQPRLTAACIGLIAAGAVQLAAGACVVVLLLQGRAQLEERSAALSEMAAADNGAARRSWRADEDRFAEPVHVMDARTVAGALLIELDDFDAFGLSKSCHSSTGLCKPQRQFRSCSWCAPGADCLQGDMRVNGAVLNGEHLRSKLHERYNQLTHKACNRLRRQVKNVVMRSLVFECRFQQDIPLEQDGKVTISWPSAEDKAPRELPVAHRVRRTAPLVPPGSVAVCGRATFGEANANDLIRFAEYYRFHGFRSVYMYNPGLNTLNDPLRLTQYLREQDVLRYVDVRDHLDRMFGGASVFAFLQAYSGAQMWTKHECALRARRDGHAWVLHVDHDEFVFPGVNLIASNRTMGMAEQLVQFAEARATASFTVGSMLAPCGGLPGMTDGTAPRDGAAWGDFMERTAQMHVEEEAPAGADLFAHNADPADRTCPEYKHCSGARGVRKVFASTTEVHPMALRVHGLSRHHDKSTAVASVDDLFLRHYRCLNYVNSPPRAFTFPEWIDWRYRDPLLAPNGHLKPGALENILEAA